MKAEICTLILYFIAIKLDNKSRIVVPEEIRRKIGAKKGEYIVIKELAIEKQEIVISIRKSSKPVGRPISRNIRVLQ